MNAMRLKRIARRLNFIRQKSLWLLISITGLFICYKIYCNYLTATTRHVNNADITPKPELKFTFKYANPTSKDNASSRIVNTSTSIRKRVAEKNHKNSQAPIKKPEIPMRRTTTPTEKLSTGFYQNRIVHFDLKGAPPRVEYLKKVFKLIADADATGIMMEWEDMFPYKGILEKSRNTDAYTMQEVEDLLSAALNLNLIVIPLVQTFGHLEWILKSEKFIKYRENELYPQVICAGDEEAVAIVKESIAQVIKVHSKYGIEYFHIGADEAFEFNVCEKDIKWATLHPELGQEKLAPYHISAIASYVKKLSPNTTVLAWYDLLKTFDANVIKQFHLDLLLEPVVWDYSQTLVQQNYNTWMRLSTAFPTAWASSSFKGGFEPNKQQIELQRYIRNNQEWVVHKMAYGNLFKKGIQNIIITGWQRFDHFAVLCELLPVGLPSLIINLQIAYFGSSKLNRTLTGRVRSLLNCSNRVPIDISDATSIAVHCEFPGYRIFTAIQTAISNFDDVFNKNEVRGWLNPFNIHHNISQAWYLEKIKKSLESQLENINALINNLRVIMSPVFYENTINEWLYEYVEPALEKTSYYLNATNRLLQIRKFPRRNHKILPISLKSSSA